MNSSTFNILKYGNSISDEFGRQIDENLTVEVMPFNGRIRQADITHG